MYGAAVMGSGAHGAAQEAGFPRSRGVARGFVVSLIYTYVLTDGGEIMGRQMAVTSAVIAALLLFFVWYSWLMTRRSVLR
jgi:hypothetical protein